MTEKTTAGGATPPSTLYVWLVPSAEMLDQPGRWRIRKWDTEPFPEANYVASETGFSTTDAYSNGWNEALDRALLACEAEQAKYKRQTLDHSSIRGSLEYAMNAIRELKVKP